jgi:hypothetical protein
MATRATRSGRAARRAARFASIVVARASGSRDVTASDAIHSTAEAA